MTHHPPPSRAAASANWACTLASAPGLLNAITDIASVRVSYITLFQESVRGKRGLSVGKHLDGVTASCGAEALPC